MLNVYGDTSPNFLLPFSGPTRNSLHPPGPSGCLWFFSVVQPSLGTPPSVLRSSLVGARDTLLSAFTRSGRSDCTLGVLPRNTPTDRGGRPLGLGVEDPRDSGQVPVLDRGRTSDRSRPPGPEVRERPVLGYSEQGNHDTGPAISSQKFSRSPGTRWVRHPWERHEGGSGSEKVSVPDSPSPPFPCH